jgi:hypothetical protein
MEGVICLLPWRDFVMLRSELIFIFLERNLKYSLQLKLIGAAIYYELVQVYF